MLGAGFPGSRVLRYFVELISAVVMWSVCFVRAWRALWLPHENAPIGWVFWTGRFFCGLGGRERAFGFGFFSCGMNGLGSVSVNTYCHNLPCVLVSFWGSSKGTLSWQDVIYIFDHYLYILLCLNFFIESRC